MINKKELQKLKKRGGYIACMCLASIFIAAAGLTGCGSTKDSQAGSEGKTEVSSDEDTQSGKDEQTEESADINTESEEGKTSQNNINDAAESVDSSVDASAVLEDGTYEAQFDTDSSMFHVNETKDGKGILTVAEGSMTIHVSLASTGIINLYVGSAEEAKTHEADWLMPTTDSVTYEDGITEEVYGFDVPVPVLNQEFSVAILGKKGTWYDHKVKVVMPE